MAGFSIYHKADYYVMVGSVPFGDDLTVAETLCFPLTTQGFFLLDASQFASGNKPALTPYISQHFAFDDRFVKTTQQLFWRFICT